MSDYLTHAMRDAGAIELRHQAGDRWMFGLFNDEHRLREEIGRRCGGGNVYTSLNRPRRSKGAPNAMTGSAITDADIEHYVRLPFDFDPVRPPGAPSSNEEMLAAMQARDRLVTALSAFGWPRPVVAMSGNGAHAVYRWRQRVDSETAAMMSALYSGLKRDFGSSAATFDSSVRNPGRIWRCYGTTNRKGIPTIGRPHRLAVATIPARWEAVSPRQVAALANSYARRPTPTLVIARPRTRIDGAGDYRTIDVVGWFRAHGHYRRHLGEMKHAVRCPWDCDHSVEDDDRSTSTVVWEAEGSSWPNFKCSHGHCDGRGIRDVLDVFGDADAFCGASWRASA